MAASQPASGGTPRKDWEGLADERIREAMANGVFDNLPGLGQPIPGIDDVLDENWWLRSKLKSEGLTISREAAEQLLRQQHET